jgi:hypothetical protein
MRLLNLNDKNYVLKIIMRYPTNTLFLCTKHLFQLTNGTFTVNQSGFSPHKKDHLD